MLFTPPLDPESVNRINAEEIGLDAVIRLTDSALGTPLEDLLDRYPVADKLLADYADYRLDRGVTTAQLDELASRVRKLLGKERGGVVTRAIIRAVDEAINTALHGHGPLR